MKKLSGEYLKSFKKIMINLIVILILILSFVYYRVIAADNEYLVVDAPESNSVENNVYIDFENTKENLTYETGERRSIHHSI